ncbi:hypothetical protein ACJX0J_013455, partial [Zea mays]
MVGLCLFAPGLLFFMYVKLLQRILELLECQKDIVGLNIYIQGHYAVGVAHLNHPHLNLEKKYIGIEIQPRERGPQHSNKQSTSISQLSYVIFSPNRSINAETYALSKAFFKA